MAGRKVGDGRGRLGGRKAGTPNKATAKAREALSLLADNNAEKAQAMLDRVVDPKEWLQLYLRLCEFSVPKMSSVSLGVDVTESDLKSELEMLAEEDK